MTATPETTDATEHFDVVIIGAGISGIGAAHHIAARNPGVDYVILERRDRIGGTWDLFRYPGVRSDSSIFTLCFPWEPWRRREGVADGDHIRDYLEGTARKHGIDTHIRFGTYVRAADWNSDTDTWTVHAEHNGAATAYTAGFLFFGSGYYDYDEPYTPEFAGIDRFGGTVVHPQHWPEDLDYSGRKVLVIGSGATAITLVPALARKAAKVAMLQRSPTYILSFPRVSPLTEIIRKVAPRRVSHAFAKWRNALLEAWVWFLARTTPALMKWIIRRQNTAALPPGYPVDEHFMPRYNPWDQRLCVDADADLFQAIRAGTVEIITDHIDRFDATGVWLKSGPHLTADIVATATGMRLQALGGVLLSLDGEKIKPQDRFVYKAHMLEAVPNLAWCVGYTNASWTLRADMTAEQVAKLLAYMGSRGYTHAYPHRGPEPIPEKLAWDLQAGYVLRNPHALPRSGTKRPWKLRHNYLADKIDHRFDRIEESMIFGRAADRSPLSA